MTDNSGSIFILLCMKFILISVLLFGGKKDNNKESYSEKFLRECKEEREKRENESHP
jgi:hypothetical protein